MIVLSKYIFCIAIYVACCIIYAIETLVVPGLGTIDATLFLLMLLVTSVFIGIYLPVQYKLGYAKTKFVFAVVIMASPFILPQLMKMENVNLKFLSMYSPLIVYTSVFLFSLIFLIVSVILSMKFYSDTDLT